MKNYIDVRSEKDVIKILEDNGIRVVYKPVALLPHNIYDYDVFNRNPIGIIETDIYEAINKLEIIKKITPDPFS